MVSWVSTTSRSDSSGAEALIAAKPAAIPAGRPSENRFSAGAERPSTPVSTCTSSSTNDIGRAIATAVANIAPPNERISINRSGPSHVAPGGKLS